jgi:TolB-like protein/DNA-binding winged helix-turn-helix (wHTH) protein
LYALHPVSATKPSAPAVLRYRFGPYEADLTRDELRKFGVKIRLEPKPWYLLVVLLERAGELVTRSELQRALWGEDVFVDFEHGLNVAVKKLRGALSDSADAPAYIETVAGEGYRFIGDVEQVLATAPASASPEPIGDALVLKVTAQSSMQLADSPALQPERGAEPPLPAVTIQPSWLQKRKAWPPVAVVVCVALLTVALARLTWRRVPQPEHVHAGKIMLVVLPFENLSVDPGQEYFSDGMTEELSEQLGNLSPQRLGVIGRTSAMIYKHAPKTISQIGKDLGVGYVLEGSVRRDGSKLRVTAQLVQVSDQAHVWAQNYDRDVRDLLQVEDDVASDIARQVTGSALISLANTLSWIRANQVGSLTTGPSPARSMFN